MEVSGGGKGRLHGSPMKLLWCEVGSHVRMALAFMLLADFEGGKGGNRERSWEAMVTI